MRQGQGAQLDGVPAVVGGVARAPAVVVPVVAHHRERLLHERRPRHRAVEHNVLLLVHCARLRTCIRLLPGSDSGVKRLEKNGIMDRHDKRHQQQLTVAAFNEAANLDVRLVLLEGSLEQATSSRHKAAESKAP